MPATARTPARQVRQGEFSWRITRFTDHGPATQLNWTLTGPGQLHTLAAAGHQLYAGGCEAKSTILDETWEGLPLASSQEYLLLHKVVDEDSVAYLGWTQRLGGAGYQSLIALTALAVRGPDVFMAGNFGGKSFAFGSFTLSAPSAAEDHPTPNFVAYLRDLGPSSCFEWVQQAGNSTPGSLKQLTLQGNKLYVSGSFYQQPARLGTWQQSYWSSPDGNTWWSWLPVGQ